MRRILLTAVVVFAAAVTSSFVTSSHVALAQGPGARPAANGSNYLKGGPTGKVKTSQGLPIGGLMVQLIAQKTSVRTTVYTDPLGRYEFPKLEPGDYTLRLARPIEFHAYRRDNVRIDGATGLADIVVDRVSKSEFVPPTPDILPQLSEAEWLCTRTSGVRTLSASSGCLPLCRGSWCFPM